MKKDIDQLNQLDRIELILNSLVIKEWSKSPKRLGNFLLLSCIILILLGFLFLGFIILILSIIYLRGVHQVEKALYISFNNKYFEVKPKKRK